MLRMTEATQRVLDTALALSDEERALLTLKLAESLDGPADAGAEEAWRERIARRVAEVEAGTAKILSAEEAIARARGRIQTP